MRKLLVMTMLVGLSAAAAWADPATTGYSPTNPFPTETRWQLPPGMTPGDYQRLQNGYYYNPYNYYYQYGYGQGSAVGGYGQQPCPQGNHRNGAPASGGPAPGQPGWRQPSIFSH